jgi:predicted kinase
MPNLVILVGVPGCGKTSWSAKMLTTNFHYLHVSSDAIREELGDVTDQSQNDLVFKLFHEYIAERLSHGLDVVADSTALDRFARDRLYHLARDNGAEAHVIFFKNVDQAIMRNSKRDRVVPEDAMVRMLDKYERTCLEIIQESDQYESLTVIDRVS